MVAKTGRNPWLRPGAPENNVGQHGPDRAGIASRCVRARPDSRCLRQGQKVGVVQKQSSYSARAHAPAAYLRYEPVTAPGLLCAPPVPTAEQANLFSAIEAGSLTSIEQYSEETIRVVFARCALPTPV